MPLNNNNLVVNGLITRTIDCRGNGLEVLNADLAFGLPKEEGVIRTLGKYFNESIEKAKNQYSRYDASSETTKYEIKSRRNTYSAFPTTIIPVDKTESVKDSRLVFVFNFSNGLYYIVYDKEQFAKYEIKDIRAFRKNGIQTLKPHYMINIEDLIAINI